MTKTDSGGQAFPLFRADVTSEFNRGMTLRSWYKGHAPPIPAWGFEVKMPTKKPQPLDKDAKGEFVKDSAIKEWHIEHERQKHMQWPAIWADAMLAEDAAFEAKG